MRKLDVAKNTPTEDRGKTQGEYGHLQNQGEASTEPTLPTSSSWTSSLQNCKTRFRCLSHPVCSTLIWQPEQTAREALIPDVPPLLPSHQSGLSTGAPPPRSLPQSETLSKHSIPSPTAWLCLLHRLTITPEMICVFTVCLLPLDYCPLEAGTSPCMHCCTPPLEQGPALWRHSVNPGGQTGWLSAHPAAPPVPSVPAQAVSSVGHSCPSFPLTYLLPPFPTA